MTNKSNYLLILLMIIIVSFPSICFSKSITVEGEYCEIYLGDLKNKKELEIVRKTVRMKSIKDGLLKLDDNYTMYTRESYGGHIFLMDDMVKGRILLTDECVSHIIGQYLEKVVVISHTEKGRHICDKVKITLDPEVVNKYISLGVCKQLGFDPDPRAYPYDDINDVLTKKSEKINIGLIIETKIPDLEGYKRELLENEEEKQFFYMIERNKDKYKLIDRRHLSKVLEEQKLSSSGITDSETFKLGKILNLDIIVLRLIYEGSQVTKVLRVETGEVLLFNTYKPETTETVVPVEVPAPAPVPRT